MAADAAVKALAGKGRELDFGHVEPRAVLGGIVKLVRITYQDSRVHA